MGLGRALPSNLTISITRACQSNCLTCDCGKDTREGRVDVRRELSVQEWKQIIAHMTSPTFLTISGGEPFLSPKLKTVALDFAKYRTPKFVTIPTNGLNPRVILSKMKRILDVAQDVTAWPERKANRVIWYVNVSVDGIGQTHDQLRGITGNWDKAIETLENLLWLRKSYPNLRVGVHTVSTYNVGMIWKIMEYFKQYPLDNHIAEIAEQRYELGTMGRSITPCDRYGEVIPYLKEALGNRKDGRLRRALRLTYYDSTETWCQHQNRQPVPCMASISSCHITETGKLVSCCARWVQDGLMGDLREYEYDFRKAWFSPQADRVRASIKNQECACPLASAAYSSLLCSPRSLLKIAKEYVL
jgi:MoaA/NifB/PqqE/SkfB family radical SAM enzyme